MQKIHEKRVLEHLESIYGETDRKSRFIDRIRELSVGISQDCYQDILKDLEDLREGSNLEGMDERNLSVRLRVTLADSIAYMVLRRCGVAESALADEMSFPYIHEFNTIETLSQLGSNVSDLAKPILTEIGKAIRIYENEISKNSSEKGLENKAKTQYNALKRKSDRHEETLQTQNQKSKERSFHDATEIRDERGLSDSDVTNGQTAGGDIDEVRDDEKEVSAGEQERGLYGTSSEM